jgi:hypothetical protein
MAEIATADVLASVDAILSDREAAAASPQLRAIDS